MDSERSSRKSEPQWQGTKAWDDPKMQETVTCWSYMFNYTPDEFKETPDWLRDEYKNGGGAQPGILSGTQKIFGYKGKEAGIMRTICDGAVPIWVDEIDGKNGAPKVGAAPAGFYEGAIYTVDEFDKKTGNLLSIGHCLRRDMDGKGSEKYGPAMPTREDHEGVAIKSPTDCTFRCQLTEGGENKLMKLNQVLWIPKERESFSTADPDRAPDFSNVRKNIDLLQPQHSAWLAKEFATLAEYCQNPSYRAATGFSDKTIDKIQSEAKSLSNELRQASPSPKMGISSPQAKALAL